MGSQKGTHTRVSFSDSSNEIYQNKPKDRGVGCLMSSYQIKLCIGPE